MVVEDMDTTFIVPDAKGNFNFKTKPGRVKIFTVADGFITEMNSVNAGDGSVNTVNVGLVKQELVKDYERSVVSAPVVSSDKLETVKRITDTGERYSYGVGKEIGTKESFGIDMISQTIKSGVLTAREVNDFAKWDLWNDLTANEFRVYSGFWKH